MKSKFSCIALAVAVLGMQLCSISVTEAQTYQDLLKQVSTPGYVDGNSPPPPASDLPTLDTVFQEQSPDAPASRVPSAVVDNMPATNSDVTGGNNAPTHQFMRSDQGTPCNVNCPVNGTIAQPGNIYSPSYTAPVYVPGQNMAAVNPASSCTSAVDGSVANSCSTKNCNSGRNFVYGIRGLVFDRDYEDDVYLARNAAGQQLRSTDADVGNLGGLEFFLGTRNCNGFGLDLRYWGLFTNSVDYTLTGASFTSYIPDLANVTWPNNGRTIEDVINGSTSHNVHRDNEIHNVEFNMLRNAGCFTTRRGRIANYELLAGFRWFEFADDFHWDIVSPTAPTMLFFDHNVQNTLLGFQLGGLTEICLSEKLRLNAGTKVGIFNNRARVEQVLQNELGEFASVDGSAYNFRNAKNDVSMLGELNLAVAFHYNPCSRITVGYRAIGVSGIALGPNQLSNTNYLAAVTDVQSNADLLLHGSFFGLEFCR